MPRGNKQMLTSYMCKEDYDAIKKIAGQAKISVSKYVRSVCLGHEIRGTVDQEAILELAKTRGDLARLGGLLKMGLRDNPDLKELRPLLESIEKNKQEMATKFNILVEKLTATQE